MNPSPADHVLPRDRRINSVAAVLLVAAVMVLIKPYAGIRHDSTLYFGQALLILHPEEFAGDLFFAFGSQAQFTFFPYVLSILMRFLTPEAVSMGLTVLGLALFIMASMYLLRRLLPREFQYWCLLGLLVMPPGYGAMGVFTYAEPFLTARTFAEPLVLVGLGMLLRAKWLAAGCLLVLAAVAHPLQAAPALVLAWVIVSRQKPLFWHLAWGLIPFAALAALGVEPFARFAAVHDAQWLAWIVEPNQHVFMMLWPQEAWYSLLTDIFLLCVCWKHASPTLRRWVEAVLIAGAICFASAFLLGDVLHLVLPTGMQLWRVHWLMHWTAMASVPFIIIKLWTDGTGDRVPVAIVAAVALLGAPIGKYGAGTAVLMAIPLFIVWPRIKGQIQPWVRKAVLLALVAAVLIAYVKFAAFILTRDFDEANVLAYAILVTILHPLPLWGLLYWGVRNWSWRPFHVRAVGVVGLVCIIALASTFWDRRSTWNKYVEHSNHEKSPFGYELRPGSQVYWLSELLTPWLVLRRASYWSGSQEAGLLFNRGTAEEAMRREKIFSLIEFQSRLCSMLNTFTKDPEKCAPDEEVIKTICAEAEGQLDYIVLTQKLKYGLLGKWEIPKLDVLERPVTYYLYQCTDFPQAPVPQALLEKK